MMDPAVIANPWFQAGMVGAFMAFSLALVGLFVRYMNGRDRDSRSERNQRDSEWRQFLEAEREFRRDDTEQIRINLQQLTTQQLSVVHELKHVAEIVVRHDESTRAAAARIMAAEAIDMRQSKSEGPG